jgi:hypothetical protein
LIEDAEHQWAPLADPVFSLVPTQCEEHISLVYVQLGSPEVGYHSFWDVYNQLRDAVDSEMLFESSLDPVDEDDVSDALDANQPPLQDLEPCEFGQNGVPAMQHEGRADSFLPFCSQFLIFLPEFAAGLGDRDSGMVASNFVFTQVLMFLSFFLLEDGIMVPFSDQDYELY